MKKRLFSSLIFKWFVPFTLAWEGILVFEDNFDEKLDPNKWIIDTGCNEDFGPKNQECYNENNVKVENGKLIITAKQEKEGDKDYTSGRIHQIDKFAHGTFVVNAKLARGEHLWPAIWLLSENSACRYEEIDIAEYRGDVSSKYDIELTAHFGTNYSHILSKSAVNETTFDLAEGFHEYAIEWLRDSLTWYIDRKEYFSVSLTDPYWESDPDIVACGDSLPFSLPAYFILNLAVGGTFFEDQKFDPNTWENPSMTIDYVRIYKSQDGNPATNKLKKEMEKVVDKVKELTNG